MTVEMLKDTWQYLQTVFEGAKPCLAVIGSFICYVCFPEDAYLVALIAVLGAAFMDILTKSYAICKKYGGYKKSVKLKRLMSKKLWKGTEVKIVSYLVIAILTGLSYRVIYLKTAGILLGSFVYSVMFMRELQSNVENLIDAGAKLEWLLLFSKKKNKELLKDYEEENEELLRDYTDKHNDLVKDVMSEIEKEDGEDYHEN